MEPARALLAFGMTEGRRYKDGELQITPECIEHMLPAGDLLHRQITPTWQERADFERAYWHLTGALTPDPRGDPCPDRETAAGTTCASGEVSALRLSRGICHTVGVPVRPPPDPLACRRG